MREVKDLKEKQELALNIFKNVQEFCENNNIDCYLAYGSLIGAIRHKGFIPWDDDIDLWMKREDYIRFVTTFPSWGKSRGLYINSPETTDNYNRTHSQVCMSNTELIFNNRESLFKEGLFIDIFVIDGTPNNTLLRWFRMTELQIIKDIGILSAYKNQYDKGLKSRLLFLLASFVRKLNCQKIMQRYSVIASKTPCSKSKYIQIPIRGKKGRNLLFPASFYSSGVKVDFEDIIADAPVEYDKILSTIYNDYMSPPPENKRVPHHEFEIFIEE